MRSETRIYMARAIPSYALSIEPLFPSTEV